MLLAVRGIRNAEVPATAMSSTGGSRAWRPVNVSWRLMTWMESEPHSDQAMTDTAFFLSCVFVHTRTPGATTAIISSVCPQCGTVGKSGKPSCCGHGGSWFNNCGGTGNSNFGHTWHEGIRACKAWSPLKTAISQQSNAAQRRNYFNGARP